MIFRQKCKCGQTQLGGSLIQGRGICDKHGIYHMNHGGRTCPKCAEENGVCPDCGKKLNYTQQSLSGSAEIASPKLPSATSDKLERCVKLSPKDKK
jgi:hypothetical protein